MSIDSNSTPSDDETTNLDLPLSFTATPGNTLDDLDGLDDARARLHTVVSALVDDAPIKTHSVLVHGPSGNGKTHLADAVAGELADAGFAVGWFDAFDEFVGEEADAVGQAVRETVATAPSVLVLDGLPEHRAGEVFPRLREEFERVNPDEQVLVVATATPEGLAGHTSSPFETSIALETPDESRAVTLLESYVADYAAESGVDAAVDVDDETLRETATGMSAADLECGTKRTFQEATVASADGQPTVTTASLEASLGAVADNRPQSSPFPSPPTAAVESRFVEETDVSFDDVGGLDDVKAELRAALEHPVRFADTYEACGLNAPGVLLYGAPGNGKTMLAKALANEYDRTFIAVNGPELENKYVGETEKNIRKVFAAARKHAPSVVFFDEFDAVAGNREEASASHEVDFVNTLLTELDGFRDTSDVLVVAATNRPAALDPAVLREGRLGRHVHVPLPDDEAATAIAATHLDGFPLADDVTPGWVAGELPADVPAATIAGVCEQALRWHAMRRAAEEGGDLVVVRDDVRAAIDEYPMPDGDDDPAPPGSSFY